MPVASALEAALVAVRLDAVAFALFQVIFKLVSAVFDLSRSKFFALSALEKSRLFAVGAIRHHIASRNDPLWILYGILVVLRICIRILRGIRIRLVGIRLLTVGILNFDRVKIRRIEIAVGQIFGCLF